MDPSFKTKVRTDLDSAIRSVARKHGLAVQAAYSFIGHDESKHLPHTAVATILKRSLVKEANQILKGS